MNLMKFAKKRKKNIKKDSEEVKKLISPTYEKMAEDSKNQIANLDKGYQTLTTEISKQGEEWHTEIDAVIIKIKTKIDDIKVKHRVILQKQLDKIIEIQFLIQKILNNLKVIEESNELSMVIEYKSQNRDLSKLPPKVMVSLPKFFPKQIDREMIYFFFGQITPLSTAILEIDLTQKETITSARNHLVEPKLVTIIQTDIKELCNVAFVDEENIWTSGATDDIKRFNTKGLIHQTIKTKSGSWPVDIAVDIDGNLLYCDGCARTVNKVKNGETEELFKLPEEWTPSQMCVTSSGDFLLSMFTIDETQSKVVRYSGSKEKQSIQFDDEGKSFFSGNSNVKYITENRNHDICVTDNGS